MGIPIVIGVTGYLRFRERDTEKLSALIKAELSALAARCPHSELVLMSAVAAGADTLCAQIALALGIKLVCPLPMPVPEYRKDFSPSDAAVFDSLISRADSVFVAPDTEPAPKSATRDFHYRQAGIYIAEHSHALLALWDGSPPKPEGCGAAEAVGFMLCGEYENAEGCFKAANDGSVIRILTQRADSKAPDAPEVRLMERKKGSLYENLRVTDAFNRDAAAEKRGGGNALLPDEHMKNAGAGLKRISSLYQTADRLSLFYQQKTLRAIKCFSIFGVMLVLLFLLYDELSCDFFLPCYGAVMLVYLLLSVMAGKGKHHEKYLQYRMLSETLRAQFYLLASGAEENIGRAFTWTQKQDSAWIREAVSALLIGPGEASAIPADVIKAAWIDGQLAYHQRALRRTQKKNRVNERAAKAMLLASAALFLLVMALEFILQPAMETVLLEGGLPAFLLPYGGEPFTLRGLMKILLGAVPAGTVFLSNYYGKLSLKRKSIDHEKMAMLYAQAKERFERGRMDQRRLFAQLAREEIVENGDWYSYCRENAPSFDL